MSILGVDIAESYLDAAIGKEKRRFANERIGHRELVKWVRELNAPVQVICESSGGYERALVQALARAKISLMQANRVRQFARAAGILAKTDRIDAELLCEFGKSRLSVSRSQGSGSRSGFSRCGALIAGEDGVNEAEGGTLISQSLLM